MVQTATQNFGQGEKVNKCPSAGVSFHGNCPVTRCPAHTCHYGVDTASSCMVIQYGAFSQIKLVQLTNMAPSGQRLSFEIAPERLLEISNIAFSDATCCPNCFIPGKEKCVSQNLCAERKESISRLSAAHKISPKPLWHLIRAGIIVENEISQLLPKVKNP